MKWILLATLMLNGAPLFADDGDVETGVDVSGGVTYFEEEDHPMKMDWDSWTLCWGANDKSNTANRDSINGRGKSNAGTIEDTALVDGPLNRMLVSRTEWDNKFDKKDMTFKINIKRAIGRNQRREERSTCTTHSWDYKVNKANLHVKTSVQLRVPANVWVMRMKTLTNRGGYKAEISKVRPMPNAEKQEAKVAESFPLGDYQYFFTRPGEDFKIDVEVDDQQVRDLDLVASFEVTFVGQNRCEQAIRDVVGPAATSVRLVGGAKEALSKIESELAGAPNAEGTESLHRATLFIGCLMNRDVSEGLFYNNDAGQIQALMSSVSTFERSVNDKMLANDAYHKVGDAMKLITQMSLASLQASVLEGVKPFCQKFPLFDKSSGTKIGAERGFIRVGRNLKESRNLLGTEGFSTYYSKLLSSYSSAIANGLTYRQIMADPASRAAIVDFAKLFEANNKVKVAHRINGLLADLPGLRPTAVTVRLAKSARDIEQITGRIHEAFSREIERFIARSDVAPENLADVTRDVRALVPVEYAFRQSANQIVALVDNREGGSVTSEFTTATEAIITSGSNNWLAQVYQGFFIDFLQTLDPEIKKENAETYQSKAIAEVQECLIGFSSNVE